MSSAYLRLLIFLPAILIPTCVSSSPAFRMMYSAHKLNKQVDNIQPWHTPFPIWNQSVVPCPVLIVASWPAYRFLKRQVRWSGIPISFRIFHYIAGYKFQDFHDPRSGFIICWHDSQNLGRHFTYDSSVNTAGGYTSEPARERDSEGEMWGGSRPKHTCQGSKTSCNNNTQEYYKAGMLTQPLVSRVFIGILLITGDAGSIPDLGSSLEKEMVTSTVFLPGKSHGQQNLLGYSPQVCKERQLSTHTHIHTSVRLD